MPGGVDGHAGQCESDSIGLVGQETFDRLDWDVPFDGVAVDECGVARGGFDGYATLGSERGAVSVIGDPDAGSVCL